jgi:hypothetical protein
MLTVEQVIERLKDRKLTVVAERTGLHYQTVLRISKGNFKEVSYSVIKSLSDYLIGGDTHNG